MATLKCQTCGGNKRMVTITKEKTTTKGKLIVHNVPAEQCDCETKIAFRPLLMIEDYSKKMVEDINSVEYSYIEKIYKDVATQNLI